VRAQFELLRELLASGVLCERVDDLWMEWHEKRVNWRTLKLPTQADELKKMYTWMLTTMGGRGVVGHREDRSPHCRTILGLWS
jgi:hypothetical protein